MRLTPFLSLLLPLAACAGTPEAPPGSAADRMLAALADGRSGRADDLFESLPDEDARQEAYPVLYDAAKSSYTSGDYAEAAAILGFVSEHYPDASAAREGQLYALFLERSRHATPDEELTRELSASAAALRDEPGAPAPWVDLVEVQTAIDGERLEDARQALARFETRWDGRPAELRPYVDDLSRYLASH